MTDGYVPTPQEAKELTEEAIDLSGVGADEQWLSDAEETTMWVAERKDPFSANDVWLWLEVPKNRRSLGYVFRRLQGKGAIRPTGERTTSMWGHGQDIALWTKT